MNLLEFVEVDVCAKLDELIVSRFWCQDINAHNVLNEIINNLSIAIG